MVSSVMVARKSFTRDNFLLPGVKRPDCFSVLSFTSSLSSDVDMEVDHFTNGVTESSSNGFLNGSSKHATEPDDCDADMGGWRL